MANDYMRRRTYNELDNLRVGNEVTGSVEWVSELLAGLYPDTSRYEPRIDDVESAIDEFEKAAAEYIAEIRKLIAEDK